MTSTLAIINPNIETQIDFVTQATLELEVISMLPGCSLILIVSSQVKRHRLIIQNNYVDSIDYGMYALKYGHNGNIILLAVTYFLGIMLKGHLFGGEHLQSLMSDSLLDLPGNPALFVGLKYLVRT